MIFSISNLEMSLTVCILLLVVAFKLLQIFAALIPPRWIVWLVPLRRRKWTYQTVAGLKITVESPFHSEKAAKVASAWIRFASASATGWALNPMTVAFAQFSRQTDTYASKRRLAQRLIPMQADKVISSSRRIILFLRSFGDDEPYSELEQALIIELGDSDTALVAIGKPGEQLPPHGFARIYVPEDHWKTVVADLVSRSALVVLKAGESDGLAWEMQQIVKTTMPRKIMVVVSKTRNARQRERIIAAINNQLPHPIIDDGTTCAWHFNDDWSSQPLKDAFGLLPEN